MFKLICLCFFTIVLYSISVHSWDIAIGVNNHIEFYKENGSRIGIVTQQFEDVKTLSFDFLKQTFYFADNKHKNISIFAFHMNGKMSIEHIVKKNMSSRVAGVAVDPVTEKLFWTTSEGGALYWMSLRETTNTSGVGSVFLSLQGESPQQLTVDSCRGFIYWTNIKDGESTIERASIKDGSNRIVIVSSNLSNPTGITLHQGLKKIFWIDTHSYNMQFKIESADLDGGNRQQIYNNNYFHKPYHIAVSNKAIYWTDWSPKNVWMLPLINSTNPIEFNSFGYDSPSGIVINHDLLEQTENVQECASLRHMIIKNLESYSEDVNDEIIYNVDASKYVLDYCKDINDTNSSVKCKNSMSNYPYVLCYNHCVNGTCYIDSDNLPKCRCQARFEGDRCQYDICHNYCLNNGVCIVNEENKLSCECLGNWTGERCHISKQQLANQISCVTKDYSNKSKDNNNDTNSDNHITNLEGNRSNQRSSNKEIREEPTIVDRHVTNEQPNSEELTTNKQNITNNDVVNIEKVYIEEVDEGRMSEAQCRAIIICLSLMCLCFITSTVALSFKVLALKKRPRINKRFIVNKNVTPLTSRPQCEVTIENCCNMNICETPCFEPSDFIEQVQEAAKKEEKKNLLLNMQHTEDPY